MAQFTPTPEEEAAASYLDWDNDSIGKLVKAAALTRDDPKGDKTVRIVACANVLASLVDEAGSDSTVFDIKGLTRQGKPLGDWIITIVKRD